MTDQSLTDIYNYLQLSEQVATAGQPTAEQFVAIRDAGFKLVINLALPTSTNALANEAQIVEKLGMTYIHIPVDWENPQIQAAEQFFNVMQAHADQPVFVHCAANMRVSVFMYLYRTLYQGIDKNLAQQDLHQIWTPNETWQNLITTMTQQHS